MVAETKRFRKINKSTCIVITLTLFMYIAMLIVTISGILRNSVRNVVTEDRLSCLYNKEKDALPVINANMSFPTNSIFFIEPSCRYLTWRQACSVESAARTNPNSQINLFLSSFIPLDKFKSTIISTLQSIPNIKIARINIEDYTKGTPLYEQLKQPIDLEKDLNMEINDVLKYFTIFKYSGTYLALDVLVTSSLSHYERNWVVKQTNSKLSPDMFSFSTNVIGRELASFAYGILKSHFFMPENHFHNDTIMKSVLTLWCGTTEVYDFVTSKCKGLQIIGPNHITEMSALREYFYSPEEVKKWNNHKIFSYKNWHYQDQPDIFKKSLSKIIGEEYCPSVNHYYKNKISNL